MKRKSAWVAALLVIVIAGLVYWFAPKRGTHRAHNHWAFIAPKQKVPVTRDSVWIRNPIDAFVLDRLRSERIEPAPEADRTVLVRRLSLDLTGLPPRPAEVDDFLQDRSPSAYERVVDRLLASPHFGEKWARHWLDLARYADSDGYEQDWFRKYAYNYRDWVIRAINSDLPMDQFTVQQIAGDLAPNSGRDEQTATGFHSQTLLNREPGTDAEEFRCKEVADRVNTTASAWLGLSVACAECHDHPHDPITQKEYYQLYAFFNNADVHERPYHNDAELAAIRAQREAWYERSNHLAKAIAGAVGPGCADLEREFAAHLKIPPVLPRANKIAILAEREHERRDTHLHVRGDFLRKGDKVKPAALSALHSFKARKRQPDRLDLALWLVDGQNPLTARVMVNQIWAHLFGRGLVSTPDDFGTHGAKPSHPELLDWLAVELRKLGWSRKELIKLIVSSAAYRQSSQTRPELTDRDPENLLLARQNRFRLSAEDIRDSHLAVSGMLQYRLGGPSFRPPMPTDLAAISFGYEGPMQKWIDGGPDEQYRRSLYILFHRTMPEPMLTIFDAPDSTVSCSQRERSNNPLQALAALNHPLFAECSRSLGMNLAVGSDCQATEKIKTAFKRCLGRDANSDELQRLLAFYEQQLKMLRSSYTNAVALPGDSDAQKESVEETTALILVARVLMNLEEFMVRE